MKKKTENQARNRTRPQELMEKQLWKSADKLRKNIDAAEYKHVVLGLVFLRYVSDAFEELRTKLQEDKNADPEDREHYLAENVFFVPKRARWDFVVSRARQPDIGKTIDDAMGSVETENISLKGVLPKVYTQQNLDPSSLGELVDLIGNIALGDAGSRSTDVLGRVFEHFLGEFALAEGRKGGQFYTPASIVKLLVEMIEPYSGRVYDPCCGSGGMFVMSEKFIKEHQGRVDAISVYGQESNRTTYRLARMNLAISGIDGSQVKWNSEGSFLNDLHPDLKADFILANPPFNDSDWSGDRLREDGRWKYGVPPVGNANFAWVQHFVCHLAPSGVVGIVLSKGSLTSKSSNEDIIRKNLVDAGLVDCIVSLPPKLFLNTQIPACLWFLSRKRDGSGTEYRRKNEILFMDANALGHLINRRTLEFSDEDIARVAGIYHSWRKEFLFKESEQKSSSPSQGGYKDIPGFCASVSTEKVRELNYVLSPGRYVGFTDREDDFDFAERFSELKAEFEAQLEEEAELNRRIKKNLKRIDF